jgi:hypothetical protein
MTPLKNAVPYKIKRKNISVFQLIKIKKIAIVKNIITARRLKVRNSRLLKMRGFSATPALPYLPK